LKKRIDEGDRYVSRSCFKRFGRRCFVGRFNRRVRPIGRRKKTPAFVELEMKAAGILDFATNLHNPDFAKMADAAGVLGLTAETPEQVRPMLGHALEHDGPALVEVAVNRQELAMPPSIELNQMMGFSLYMVKAVLNGRGDEIIDLVKTNLFR
jgi:pyruvate dehydrogenase (quinone)